MHPRDIRIDDFSYDLPDEKIALYPLSHREQSKLLIYRSGNITTDVFGNVAAHLPNEALLIFNDTKVVQARILFKKDSGATIEVFCLEPADSDIALAMQQRRSARWKCFVGGAKKWKDGPLRKQVSEQIGLEVQLLERTGDAYIIQFDWNADISFAELLDKIGSIPLPPYIKREANAEDKNRYQTVFADQEGSVAAPTAGLHFTDRTLNEIRSKGVITANVTLHVGAGTFKPVSSEKMEDHEMHAEFIDVKASTIEMIRDRLHKQIICIGTTSMRTIESLYWLGSIVHERPDLEMNDLIVSQWQPYDQDQHLSAEEALTALLNWMQRKGKQHIITRTSIIIAPGYQFRIVKGLFTNFHQPRSTLLLLVAAFVKDWKKIYDHALKNDFRFLSYGDGSLLWKDQD